MLSPERLKEILDDSFRGRDYASCFAKADRAFMRADQCSELKDWLDEGYALTVRKLLRPFQFGIRTPPLPFKFGEVDILSFSVRPDPVAYPSGRICEQIKSTKIREQNEAI